MTSKIQAIGKPPVDEASRQEMVKLIKQLLIDAEAGDLSGLIFIEIRPDFTFRTTKCGPLRRIHSAGFVAQALHNLLESDEGDDP